VAAQALAGSSRFGEETHVALAPRRSSRAPRLATIAVDARDADRAEGDVEDEGGSAAGEHRATQSAALLERARMGSASARFAPRRTRPTAIGPPSSATWDSSGTL